MNRTRPSTLVGFGLAGAVVTFLLELGFATAGRPVFVPPISLPLTLVAVAVLVVLLALPIRRAVTGKAKAHVDPFRAMRIAALAKACALAGALLLGAAIGLLVYLLSRSTVGSLGSVGLAIAAVVAAAVLVAGGLIAEHFCILPPDDDEESAAHA